jgi:Permuted papain-like amidase enzyme, YaeF/YiiX, C92 family
MADDCRMKLRIFPLLAVFQLLIAIVSAGVPALREGDILFTSSERGQGEAIIAATGSPYTHCGVVFEREGKLMVLEAVQPVRVSTLAAFMANGRKEHFVAKRLKTPVKPEAYRKARAWATAQVGRDYDLRFGWDDAKLYCSELVWKIYQKAGVELCAPKRFRDYDLQRPAVRRIIDQRYGGMHRMPLDEKVVAPSDLAASPLLIDVP